MGNYTVDVFLGNATVVKAWEGQRPRDPELIQLLKRIFMFVWAHNVYLGMFYVPSPGSIGVDLHLMSFRVNMQFKIFINSITDVNQDATLSPCLWEKVQNAWGPHDWDLMARDSIWM